jgi:hypothetical protein
MMDGFMGTDLDGSGRGPIWVSFGSFLGGTEENPRETSVRIVGAPAEIQTEHLLDTTSQFA